MLQLRQWLQQKMPQLHRFLRHLLQLFLQHWLHQLWDFLQSPLW
jgi:hypothetical protein